MNEKISEIRELMKQRRTPLIREKLDEIERDLEKMDNLKKFKSEIEEVIEKHEK